MNGMINVYKEKGYTSHDVVAKLRGICRQKKIGHTGTLDPDAEGVLPVCLGTATKVCGLLTDKDKVYEAVLLLGKETDTQDTGGTVLRETDISSTETEIREAVRAFAGTYHQIPPMYSALKVNGKKLCDLARAGVEVERRPRPVHIYEIEVLQMHLPRIKLRVHCSKGTYIRTLCHDIGQKLGCGGCMEELLRTKVGMFELKDAWKLSQIQALAQEQQLDKILLPADQLFLNLPGAEVAAGFRKMLSNGNRLPKQAWIWQEANSFRTATENKNQDDKTVPESFSAAENKNQDDKTVPESFSVPENKNQDDKTVPESFSAAENKSQDEKAVSESFSASGQQMLRVYLDGLFYGIYALDEKRGDYKPVKIFGQGKETGSGAARAAKRPRETVGRGGTDHEI